MEALKTFPAIVITGPRQAGKTTLLLHEFGGQFEYRSLEDLDIRKQAIEDPRKFLNSSKPMILDEIQRAPELLHYVKTLIDERREVNGQWIITGSQQFQLMKGIAESLAGRAAILGLLPLSYGEIIGSDHDWRKKSLPGVVLRGGYPELVTEPEMSRNTWCGSYINSYLDRDIRDLKQVGDLRQFEIFVRSCAVRTGTILDLSGLASDVGVSVPTAKAWLSMLITGNQVYLLSPYYKNIGKRLIKSPKIYFMDTGLASYLMGMDEESILENSPYYGPLVETLVVIETLKKMRHNGEQEMLYYLRTRDGVEADLVIEKGGILDLIEIKSGETVVPAHAKHLARLRRDVEAAREGEARVVYGGVGRGSLGSGVQYVGWKEWLMS